MKPLATALATLTLATAIGCARDVFAVRLTPELASSYGCDMEEVMQGERSVYNRPAVGWTACELMANTGMPREIDVQESRYGFSASWWYADPLVGPQDMKLVRLERRNGAWEVAYVGW